jgi:hypothetical protein
MGLLRDRSGPAADPGPPVERFRPTTGLLTGYAGLALAAFAAVYVVVAVHTVTGLRVALGALFAAVVIWVSQLRPRATAYAERLVLKGALKDTHVPYVAIDEVTVTQMLNVFVGDHRYVCVGIGSSLGSDIRQRAKKQRQSSLLESGRSRTREFAEKAEMAAPDQTAMSYPTFVVTRIEELVDHAKRDARRDGKSGRAEVRQRPAVPEVVALAVTGIAFVVSLLL